MNNIEDILADQSRAYLYAKCDKTCYELFNANLKKHFNKFPNDQVKAILQPLINNDLIKLGYPEEKRNLLLGQVIRTSNDKIAGIIINHITHEIDADGNSLSFDKIIGSLYYVFIDYSIRILFNTQINNNSALLQKIEHYFEYIIVKNLRLFELSPEKRILFNFLVKLFFYTHIAKMNINLAYEISMTSEDEELIKSTIDIKKIAKYETFNSLYDALYDFNIITMTPNNMKYMLTNNIGLFAYINLHANIGSMIASIIISKYKHPNFAQLFISMDMINGIESIIIGSYLDKVPFEFNLLNSVINTAINQNLNSLKTVV